MPAQPPTTSHKPLRIIFMGTPDFAVPALEALIQTQNFRSPLGGEQLRASVSDARDVGGKDTNNTTPHDSASGIALASPAPPQGGSVIKIVGIYTQPPRPKGRGQQVQPSPVHLLAEKNNVPVFTPTSLKTSDAQAEFAALRADVAVVVAYGLLLPQAVLDAPKHGCINIHPSSLPRWRGAAPIQRIIMAGDASTEICIMKMDAGLDTGPVFKRSESIAIPNEMNAGALHDRLANDAVPLLLEVLGDMAADRATATPQASEGVTYANKINKEEARIDWSKSAAEIYNHIRGLSPYPGATCLLDGEVLKVFEAQVIKSPPPERGRIKEGVQSDNNATFTPINVTATCNILTPTPPLPLSGGGCVLDDTLTIACGDGNAIQLLEVQQAGKPRMKADAFLRGRKVAKGSILG